MDETGRVALPVRLRNSRPLGFPAKKKISKYILVKWMNSCLALFPYEEWTKRMTALVGNSFFDEEQLVFHRHLGPNSCEVKPDFQGRITVPKNLQQAAGLTGEVQVIGVTQHIEIWNPESYQQFIAKAISFEASANKLVAKRG